MTANAFAASFQEALAKIDPSSELPVAVGGQTGSMTVLLYTPKGTDTQEPHPQDEIYFVATGTADLHTESGTFSLKAGDAAFVPALMDHRFNKFSEDFACWAVFWGPEGGEKDAALYRFL